MQIDKPSSKVKNKDVTPLHLEADAVLVAKVRKANPADALVVSRSTLVVNEDALHLENTHVSVRHGENQDARVVAQSILEEKNAVRPVDVRVNGLPEENQDAHVAVQSTLGVRNAELHESGQRNLRDAHESVHPADVRNTKCSMLNC